MGLFSAIVKTAVNVSVGLPFAVIKDVVTMGDDLPFGGKTATEKAIETIKEECECDDD